MKHVKPLNKNSKFLKKINQVNWYTEINNEPECEDQDCLIDNFSLYMKTYLTALDYFKDKVGNYNEDQKSHYMRVLHYLYGKYTLYHALFYGRDLSEDQYLVDDELSKLGKEHDIKKSNLPLDNVKVVVDVFKGIVKKRDDQHKKDNPDGGIDEVETKFKERGLETTKTKGVGRERDRDTTCIIHDDIPYHISIMKGKDSRTDKKFDYKVEQHHLNIKKYHDIVKPLFYKIKELTGSENLWVMEGGGGQVQMFFGDENGYIAILYLDMRDENKQSRIYTLQINGAKNDKYFDGVEIPGIKVQSHKSVWGDED